MKRLHLFSSSILVTLVIVSIFVLSATSTSTAASSEIEQPLGGQQNQEDYCCCSSDELETNAGPLLEVLDDLVTKPFFRYFRVNVKKKCPYWVVHLLCTQKGNPCKFCRCDAKDIPVSLRTDADMGSALSDEWGQDEQDEDEREAGLQQQPEPQQQEPATATDSQVSGEGDPSIDRKKIGDYAEAIGNFDHEELKTSPCPPLEEPPAASTAKTPPAGKKCAKPEPHDPLAEYVDLVLNPEGNTFYLGEKASRVWRAIYEENCFQLAHAANLTAAASAAAAAAATTTSGAAAPQCREQLVFYRLISGLHTSISTHIGAYYHFPILPGDARYKPTNSYEDEILQRVAKFTPEERHMKRAYAKPNCDIFEQRLRSKPHHVANLHFVYRFVIRALTRSRSAFVSEQEVLESEHGTIWKMRDALRIGDEAADAATERLLSKLFQSHLLCSPTFNESKLLQEPNAVALLPEMKRRIRNMTTITDCISCEKCRLWGKLQLLGLATAFKIVMSPAESVPHLERKELMSLVNFARQLTDSVHNNRVMCRREPQCARVTGKNHDAETIFSGDL